MTFENRAGPAYRYKKKTYTGTDNVSTKRHICTTFRHSILDEICTPEFTRLRNHGAGRVLQHTDRAAASGSSRTMTKYLWDTIPDLQASCRLLRHLASPIDECRNICATLSELLGPCFPPRLAWIKEGVRCRLLFPSSPNSLVPSRRN